MIATGASVMFGNVIVGPQSMPAKPPCYAMAVTMAPDVCSSQRAHHSPQLAVLASLEPLLGTKTRAPANA